MEATVYVVDDDADVRESLTELIKSAGLRACAFGSARAFLEERDFGRPACALLDVRMPDMGGLDLQEELSSRGCDIPIIIVTGYGDVPGAVRAFRQGAFDFIEKPVSGAKLIKRIEEAIDHDVRSLSRRAEFDRITEKVAALTVKEHQVMRLLVEGRSLMQTAESLERSVKTVEAHSTRIKKKLGVNNRVELVRMALRAGLLEDSKSLSQNAF